MMDGWVCVKAPQTDKKGVFPFFPFFFFLKLQCCGSPSSEQRGYRGIGYEGGMREREKEKRIPAASHNKHDKCGSVVHSAF